MKVVRKKWNRVSTIKLCYAAAILIMMNSGFIGLKPKNEKDDKKKDQEARKKEQKKQKKLKE